MLQQEQIPEVQAAPFVVGDSLPPTTKELASAIIAREDREHAYARVSTDVEQMARTVEPLGMDISPEELLAEVREQRRLANQEKVMSKRKKALNGTSLAFLGGMVGACAIALFLVYTNYWMFQKCNEMYSRVSQYQEQATAVASQAGAVSSDVLLRQWTYPNGRQGSGIRSGIMSKTTITTPDSFATVWKYYKQQMGYHSAFSQTANLVSKNGEAPLANVSWNSTDGQITTDYQMQSRNMGGIPFMLFTKHAGVNTVTVMVTPGSAENLREITIYTTDARQ